MKITYIPIVISINFMKAMQNANGQTQKMEYLEGLKTKTKKQKTYFYME